MSELGLDEHLHVKDYDYGDDDGTDMSEFENHQRYDDAGDDNDDYDTDDDGDDEYDGDW